MNECRQDLVSVVIPAWNAGSFLNETLATVLAQTYPAIEVIVVDDGSTDSTGDLLCTYGDRIVVVSLDNSGGPARPRNQGVLRARGEYIAFFDSDDLMEPDKIAQEVGVFVAHPEVDVVCSGFRSVGTDGKVIKADYLVEYQHFRRDLEPSSVAGVGILAGPTAFSHLLRANFVGTSSVVCRQSVLRAAGPFDENMKNADDVDMWLRLARGGAVFAFVDRILHSYRITPGGVTARGADRVPAMIRGLENQLPYCANEADRFFIRRRQLELYSGMAWARRNAGDLIGARASYRASLALGWTPRAALGLFKTQMLSFLSRNTRN